MSVEVASNDASSAMETTTSARIWSEISSTNNYLSTTELPNLIDLENQAKTEPAILYFGWLDYGFFVGLLGVSAFIGVFYGFFSKHKQNNTSEYILGGRSMQMLPVATSLIASLVVF